MIEKLEVKEWLSFNAKLQQKKNALRKLLKEKGILKREGNNTYDKYKYFSEAQYKELFTALFSGVGLELTSSEVAYTHIEGTDKMPFGVNVSWEFTLTDIGTGFFEKSIVSGEGLDKGDKAGYKANTGAIKYYLANTFMVATGDDPETESPEGEKQAPKNKTFQKAKTKTPPSEEKDYKALLGEYIEENGFDVLSFCKEHRLNGSSTQEQFKAVYEKVVK